MPRFLYSTFDPFYCLKPISRPAVKEAQILWLEIDLSGEQYNSGAAELDLGCLARCIDFAGDAEDAVNAFHLC